MAGDIVRNNNYIADYINSHPLAPQLSSDDYGNLDAASEKLKPLTPHFFAAPSKAVDRALADFSRGFSEGFGDEQLGSWAYDPKNMDYTNPANRIGWAAWSLVGAAPEVGLRFLSGLLKGTAAGAAGGGEEGYQTLGGS